jgi:diguanylate cyclase (GGDEF)-like protein
VSRFGGDEFVILIHDPSDADIEGVSIGLAAAVSPPISLHGEQVSVSASIGVAVAAGETDPEKLIARADTAMYHAKRGQPRKRESTRVARR